MGWFKRTTAGITTETKDKKETPDGLWHKCPKCKVIVSVDDHAADLWTCSNCGHHDRINAKEYFSILFDNGEFTELDADMVSKDPLKFEDTKPYKDRLKGGKKKSGLKDALTSGYGMMNGREIVVACMNFHHSYC